MYSRPLSTVFRTRTIVKRTFATTANMNGTTPTHTITALKRWSCQDNPLPPVSQIRNIHVYDFDNTCTFVKQKPLYGRLCEQTRSDTDTRR